MGEEKRRTMVSYNYMETVTGDRQKMASNLLIKLNKRTDDFLFHEFLSKDIAESSRGADVVVK